MAMMCGLVWAMPQPAVFVTPEAVGPMAVPVLPTTPDAAKTAPQATQHKDSRPNDTKPFELTQLCKFYVKGRCRRGLACTFAHSQAELQPLPDYFKSRLCQSFATYGTCSSGDECKFAHGAQELRRPVVQKKRFALRDEEAATRAKGRRAGGGKKAALPQSPQSPQTQQNLQPQPQKPQPTVDATIAALRAEAAKLQEQIEAMRMAKFGGFAPPAIAACPAIAMDSSPSLLGAECIAAESIPSSGKIKDGWSRQSTEEGPGPANGHDGKASCIDDWADEFDDDLLSESDAGPEEEEDAGLEPVKKDEDDGEIDVAVLVKNTFVSLFPRFPPALRARAASAPPSGRIAEPCE